MAEKSKAKRPQAVTWAKVSKTKTLEKVLSLFEYRPERGWAWLQKLCFWILARIGAHHEEVVTTFTRTPMQNDDLLAYLAQQVEQLLELTQYYSGELVILIGPEEEVGLMELSRFCEWQSTVFRARTAVGCNRGMSYFDIPIVVVPWMRGVIVVPFELVREHTAS